MLSNAALSGAYLGVTVTPTGTSTVARYYVASGSAPKVRVLYNTTAINTSGFTCAWAGSFASGQVQTGYSVSLDDATAGTTGVYTSSGSGATELLSLATTLVAGHAYVANVTISQTDGQSVASSTRFVVPSGRVVYLEDYGAVGNGTNDDGTDYGNNVYTGPFPNALIDMHYGDVLKSKNPGVVLSGVSVTGNSLLVASGGLLSSHVGKPIIIYGAGAFDSSGHTAFYTTVNSVASNGKSAVLGASVTTNVTDINVLVAYPTYKIGHIDVDSNHGPGGYTIDMTGALCTSTDPSHAGFNTRLSDVTYKNVHYQVIGTTQRGSGANNDDCPFYAEGSIVTGGRWLNCYSEGSQDAGLLFNGAQYSHVVDCTDDHSYADGFHNTGGTHDVQWIRPTAYYPGDDAFANVGYLSDGSAGEPYNITWESPTLHGQDWGRGLSAIGCNNVLYTDINFNGTADAPIYMGQEGNETMDTHYVQVRRGSIINPNYRRNMAATTQGSSPSTVQDRPWLLLLSGESGYQQSDFRLESLSCTDGRYIQIISYGTGTYKDVTIIVSSLTMTGNVNAGTSWLDDSTWPSHIDMRSITVPSGSTPASAPTNAGTNGGS